MKYLFTFVLISFYQNLFSQPAIQWQKCFGGLENDYAYSTLLLNDGSIIIAGYSNSIDGDVIGNHDTTGTFSDYWIIKLDSSANILWQQCIGGTNNDYAYSILQTTDNGFIVFGNTNSNDGNVSGLHGSFDYWVVKLDNLGIIEWEKTYGGSNFENAHSIFETSDGNFILVGSTNSNDGDVSGNHSTSGPDIWIVKIDNTGNLLWQKCYGGPGNETAYRIKQTTDGNFIIAGETDFNGGDVSGLHGNGDDIWLIKIDSIGNLLKQKCIGGTGSEVAFALIQDAAFEFIIGARTQSIDGDVSGNHDTTSFIKDDAWIFKVDTAFNILWQKCLGGTETDYAVDIKKTIGGGYIVAAETYSNDGDVLGNHDTTGVNSDYWLAKLDLQGNLKWQKCLGGSENDFALNISQSPTGAYIVTGMSYSNDGDVSGNHDTSQTNADFWIVKLFPDTIISVPELDDNKNEFQVYPNPSENHISFKLNNYSFKKMNMEIVDPIGQVVLSKTIFNNSGNTFTVDIHSISKGIYKIILVDENSFFTSGFVKY